MYLSNRSNPQTIPFDGILIKGHTSVSKLNSLIDGSSTDFWMIIVYVSNVEMITLSRYQGAIMYMYHVWHPPSCVPVSCDWIGRCKDFTSSIHPRKLPLIVILSHSIQQEANPSIIEQKQNLENMHN